MIILFSSLKSGAEIEFFPSILVLKPGGRLYIVIIFLRPVPFRPQTDIKKKNMRSGGLFKPDGGGKGRNKFDLPGMVLTACVKIAAFCSDLAFVYLRMKLGNV